MFIRKHSFLALKLLLPLVLLTFTLSVPLANAASSVSILSHSKYFDSLGYLHIVGEAQNTGTDALRFVQITATYYDSGNTVVGTSFGYSTLEIIRVSEKSPFEILFLDKTQAAKVDHYSLSASFSIANPLPVGLQMLSNSSYVDTLGYMHIVGEIKNIGTSTANFVQVIATCYGSGGNVVLTNFGYTQPSDIEAGQKAPFEILVLESDRVPLVASYSLNAESTQYGMIPEFPSALLLMLLMVPMLAGILFFRKKLLKNKN